MQLPTFTLRLGDCLESLRAMPDNSVDSIVTDPPYGLSDHKPADVVACLTAWLAGEPYLTSKRGFMGKTWDSWVPGPEVWRECLRVLKPGGHVLAFAGTRSMDLMSMAVRLAGFELRDSIGYANDGGGAPLLAWCFGSGFPKSMDVSKAIDKARDDSADILRVTTFMADAADLVGVSRADVDAFMGTSDMGGWWLSRLQNRCKCPQWDQWMRLKELLRLSDEMDSEVWRLNGRKGQPGENWKVVGEREASAATGGVYGQFSQRVEINDPTDAARQWQGFGTALKPAWEPVILARKPLAEKTVAANVLAHGTGALNIDGCRVATDDNLNGGAYSGDARKRDEYSSTDAAPGAVALSRLNRGVGEYVQPSGRWPANLIHDGSEEVLAGFPQANHKTGGPAKTSIGGNGAYSGGDARVPVGYDDTGSAARFFKQVAHDDEDLATMQRFMYCPKASKRDRDEGLEGFEAKPANSAYGDGLNTATKIRTDEQSENGVQRDFRRNTHPTVKPTDLMAYLCRLVTPPGGVVLDPFMGSGSTGKAAMREGFNFIGCELSPEYLAIAEARIAHELAKRQQPEPPQSDLFAA